MGGELAARVRSELSEMVPYEPGKPSSEIAREYGLEEPPVKLASNENPFPPPDDLLEVYRDTFEHLNRYPDGGCYYLKEALSDHYDWPSDGVMVGAGSDEVVDCLAKATLGSGDEVLTARPAFVRYRMVAEMMGATPVEVPLDDSFDLDLSTMRDRVTEDTAWVCLPNPNNPTSRYVSEEPLREFLESLPEDLIVILDEAYFELMDQDDYPDGFQWLNGNEETPAHVVVLRTFSKAYGLAGLRVGYGLMSPALVRELDKVRPPFNVTRPAQAVARQALAQRDFLADCRRLIQRQSDVLVRELRDRGLEVVSPSANFMLVKAPGGEGRKLTEDLMEEGVIIRPMAPYGLGEYVRVTVGLPSENDRFLEALDRVID
jgi:histidinol-phosphate aminotransferase